MSLQVNTLVIEALMRLRGFTRKDLALHSGVRLENLNAWLQANDGTDHYVSRMNQSKIMQVLGISGEGLRRDCVHHWKIREEFLSRNPYRDLQIMLHAFGEALSVSFQRTTEPALGLSTRQVFGLRFLADACVTVEVTAPYLKSISFDPAKIDGMSWAFDKVILLAPPEFDRLINGDVTPSEFDDLATGKQDADKWARLHLIAREYGISPDEVEDFMLTKAKQAENQLALGTQVEQAVQWKKVGNGDVAPTSMSSQVNDAGAEARARLRQKSEPPRTAEVRSMQDYRLFISNEKVR